MIYSKICADSMAFALICFLFVIKTVISLECIQCDRQAAWYSPEENERHIMRCQKGLYHPTRCTNSSHTHCIFSYFKKNGVVTVTERRCGIVKDIIGCTLYKSISSGGDRLRRHRRKRHLIAGSNVDTPLYSARHSSRRREASLLVEVCTSGCLQDGCINGAPHSANLRGLVLALVILLNFYYTLDRRRNFG